MVVVHGLPEEWTKIVLAESSSNGAEAVVVGAVGLAVLVLLNVLATYFGRSAPRLVQRALGVPVERRFGLRPGSAAPPLGDSRRSAAKETR